jgi:hypothetical protein
LPATILRRAKNRKEPNYNCFFYIEISGNHVFTPLTWTWTWVTNTGTDMETDMGSHMDMGTEMDSDTDPSNLKNASKFRFNLVMFQTPLNKYLRSIRTILTNFCRESESCE